MINKESHGLLSGGQAVVEIFKSKSTKNVFGLIGSSTMELFDALFDNREINFIDVRDERTGTHMADGYSRASGQAGIIIAGQNGPGATNLVTGVAQANAAFSSVISIAGAVTSEHKGKNTFQEIDQQRLFEPITKKTYSVNQTDEIPKLMNEAYSVALQPRCGPVHINIPRDVFANKIKFDDFENKQNINLPNASKVDIEKVINIIMSSSKAVIIAGGGVKNTNGHQEIIKLAKILNIPIVSSAGHGDIIPSDVEIYAGQMGPRGNVVATKLVKEADIILAIGTRLGFNSTFFSYDNINKNASIIQIDIEKSAIGRYFPVKIGICADAKNFTKQLLDKISSMKKITNFNNWTEKLINERKKYLKERDEKAEINTNPIRPTALFKILRDVLPKNSSITLDAGTLCLQSTDALNYFEPRCLFTPLDFGLVGFSFACGLGVKIAKPNKPVISLMGDGGFGMTLSELSTAVQHKINTVTIVMNNQSWGAEKAYQRDFFNGKFIGSDIKSPPFDKIAELYGAKGFRVDQVSEIKHAVKAALNCNKPVVIDLNVDPSALYSFRRDSFTHRIK